MNANLGQVDWSNPVDMDHPLNRGLVSWWMAGEGPFWGGPLFRDLVPISSRGGGNHGTLTNGPTWQGARGRPGGFGAMNSAGGTAGYFNAGPMSIFTGGDWAIAFWLYPTGTTVPCAQQSGATTDMSIWSAGTQFIYYTEILTGNGNRWNDVMTINKWDHWILVQPGTTTANALCYRNGVLLGGAVGSGNDPAPGDTSGQFFFGNQQGAAAATSWDDVRVFNNASQFTDSLAYGIYIDSLRGYPQTLNRVRPFTIFDTGGGAAATYSQFWWNTSYDYSGLGV